MDLVAIYKPVVLAVNVENPLAQNVAVSFFAGDPGWVPDNVRLIPFADMHIQTGFHIAGD